MKKSLVALFSFLATVASAAEPANPPPSARAVMPTARRTESLNLAAEVLRAKQPGWQAKIAGLPDPFFRKNFVPEETTPEPEVAQPQLSEADVLEAIAATLNPTGTMMVDGENYLLLGGKRHRVGARLSVPVDGIVHQVTISAIDGKSYTLRLNDQELRRQLK
jgi:hypothetical protein